MLHTALIQHEYGIPEGYEWGVPRAVHFLTPYNHRYQLAYISHDFFYSIDGPGDMSRLGADEVFYEDLVQAGACKPRAWASYMAMRMFGGGSFRIKK